MIIVGIDGACRRNGKPDCLSAGAVVMRNAHTGFQKYLTCFERNSTNQRGELLALCLALSSITHFKNKEVIVVTDSEYIFKAMTKGWIASWESKGWVTASGNPVKNKDLWLDISNLRHTVEHLDYDVSFYHVKGHTISIGKATGKKLVEMDNMGYQLYNEVLKKVETFVESEDPKYTHALEVFHKNLDFTPPMDTFKLLLSINNTADIIAGHAADEADAKWIRQ